MRTITLDDQEWNTVMAVLAAGPWNQVNGILMKMGAQLQAARTPAPLPSNAAHAPGAEGNSGQLAH